ncbi:MAG: hypothetical protein WDN28_25820 [Chthoniobacter sp.]
MDLNRTIPVLNDMERLGVIQRYAIGGAVAAFLYIEPGTTYDLDIFIVFETPPGSLITLGPIYAFLLGRGYEANRENIIIEGWPVQFLPPGTPLVAEALDQSISIEVGGEQTRIFSKEHLMAICLETGRPKDYARLVQFVEEGTPDMNRFMDIVGRSGLLSKWERFKLRFLTPL